MDTAGGCAYCGRSGALTREHLWPRCIIDRTPTYNARYFGRAEKFIGGDLTIKDVCATCNNGPLGALDSYICRLYDAQLRRIALPRQQVLFLYDYGLLLRWLLKISYNTARANDSDTEVLAQFATYILQGGDDPTNIAVRLELIQPAKNPNHKSGQMKFIPPHSVRCCRVQISNSPSANATVRLVAVNSFYFWVIVWPKGMEVTTLLEMIPGTTLVPNNQQIRAIPRRNTLDSHRDWVLNPRAKQSMAEFRKRNAG